MEPRAGTLETRGCAPAGGDISHESVGERVNRGPQPSPAGDSAANPGQASPQPLDDELLADPSYSRVVDDRRATAAPAVRLATQAEIPELAGVLARAFADDPYFAFLAGNAPGREARMLAGWVGVLRYSSARLSDTYTTDDLAGAAIWIPPAHKPLLLDAIRVGPAMARLTGWGRLRTVADAVAELERRRHKHVPEPHYYLSALGVDSGRPGQGIGTALMRPVLDRCDREHIPTYLETATERNVSLYERRGFAIVEELTLPGAGVHGWLMRRAAAG